MLKIQKLFFETALLIVLLISLFVLTSISTSAQQPAESTTSQQRLATTTKPSELTDARPVSSSPTPVYKEFMGVTLGMEAGEVRSKLRHLKNKGERQDFFVFSESHSAQIGYDSSGKVTVISVDYVNNDGRAPSPESVLGEPVQPKPDGSIYQMKRYLDAGYWVAYSRTSGDNPIVTITMQKL